MDKIIGLGNALVDVLVTLEDDTLLNELGLPKGGMQLIDEVKFQHISTLFAGMKTHQATGGSAANTMLALANLGASTGFIGKVGKDNFGTFFRENLEKHHISDKLLLSDLPSGVASTFISPDGERTFGTFLGAAATLKSDELVPDMFKGYAYLYIEGYMVQDHDMILRAVQLAKEAGLQICLDLASYNIVEGDKEFFTMLVSKYVDIIFANEEEAKAYTGCEPEEALEILGKQCSIAVVKVGAKGSYIRKGTKVIHVGVIPIEQLLDTTGAGDYFAAGFLYGLTCGYPLEVSGEIGALLSGNVIQTIGTTMTPCCWDGMKGHIDKIITTD